MKAKKTNQTEASATLNQKKEKEIRTCRASARRGVGGNDPRVAQGAEVNTKLFVVILSQKLHVNLGDAVDSGGPHDGQVWRVFAGSRGAKGTDGAGTEDPQVVGPGC